jgi:uracil-DNA glycosylase
MEWSKFSHHFHPSWEHKIRPFIESEECNNIYKFLKSESQKGKKLAPISTDTYKVFQLTPLNEVVVIVLGMCPYHTTKNNMIVADGLALGCSNTKELQPSLEQFYNAIEKDVYGGMCLEGFKSFDVSFLSKQGVLMLNAALTTEIGKAGAHMDIWTPFTTYLFKNIFNYMDVPIIMLGKEAQKYGQYITNQEMLFPLSHPASASYKKTDWDSEGVFKKVTEIVKNTNGNNLDWWEMCPF